MSLPSRDNEVENVRRRLAQLAWLLDAAIVLPGSRFRIGVDALIGLIPGLGDLIGVLLSSYIVREAARIGTPPSVLARMMLNVAVEGVVGLIPVAGDVFDAVWKANQRNVKLLDAHIDHPQRTRRQSRWIVAGVTAALVVFAVLIAAVATLIVRGLAQLFAG